jgi:ABC-2 type transport system ATP-binding protein
MQSVIVAEGLTRHFGDHLAVNQLDLQVASGEVFGFLGPNGAGKTTTVRLLNGVLSADGGSARVLGYDVATEALEIRRRTGVLTETPSLYEALTARENLLFFGDLYGLPESELPRRAGALLEEFGLADRADDRVGTYSKGMRQRLAIARALLHSPELIFLDEPTSGLDPAAARMVRETIQTLSQAEGRTVFLCTHNLAEAQLLCSRVGVIDHGVLQAVGTPQELASSLWQELTVEIDLRGEPSAAVREALSRLPEVSGQSMENDRLVLTLANEDAIPTVVAAIAANGGRIYGVIPREHTLEEIYFRIQANSHGEKGGAA